MSATWLITGGCGFVGSNLSNFLLNRGVEVTIVDNLSRLGARNNLAWLRASHGADWRFIESDTRDADRMAQIVGELQPRALAHLAGQVAMTTSLADPRLDFEINAGGAFNLLEAVRLRSPDTVVLFSSSNKVYGDLEWVRYVETHTRYVAPDYPHGFAENTPLSFHSPYGCSKGAADQYALDYARMYGLRTLVFRHSSMYGGRQYSTYDQGWIGWFCQKSVEAQRAQAAGKTTEPFTISGNGKQVRDVLHADDINTLYWAGVERADQARGQAFNIGSGVENSLSLLELFGLLTNLTGASLRYTQLPPRASDQRIFIADTRLAASQLGWQPQVSAHTGIRQALAWAESLLNKP